MVQKWYNSKSKSFNKKIFCLNIWTIFLHKNYVEWNWNLFCQWWKMVQNIANIGWNGLEKFNIFIHNTMEIAYQYTQSLKYRNCNKNCYLLFVYCVYIQGILMLCYPVLNNDFLSNTNFQKSPLQLKSLTILLAIANPHTVWFHTI